jgi:hypothetical protein
LTGFNWHQGDVSFYVKNVNLTTTIIIIIIIIIILFLGCYTVLL